MKYISVLFLSLCLTTVSYAGGSEVWRSSNTATAETTKVLCQGANARLGHGVLHGVCVNTGTAGTFTVYNASAAATNPIAAIDTTAKGCSHYDVGFSSGLSYTNSATANTTVMFSCY